MNENVDAPHVRASLARAIGSASAGKRGVVVLACEPLARALACRFGRIGWIAQHGSRGSRRRGQHHWRGGRRGRRRGRISRGRVRPARGDAAPRRHVHHYRTARHRRAAAHPPTPAPATFFAIALPGVVAPRRRTLATTGHHRPVAGSAARRGPVITCLAAAAAGAAARAVPRPLERPGRLRAKRQRQAPRRGEHPKIATHGDDSFFTNRRLDYLNRLSSAGRGPKTT